MAISLVNKHSSASPANFAGAVSTVSTLNSLSPDQLLRMEQKIDTLPLLPQVLMRMLQLNSRDNAYFQKLEKLTMEDPPFAVRVLALANSASSSPASPILSIRNALTRMGATTITNLVISLALQRVFVPTSSHQVDIWKHSIRVAVATEQIAQLVPMLKVERGQAYLTGLLHDIGLFVMLEHTSANLMQIDQFHNQSLESLVGSDLEIFRFTHSELGYMACTRWGLPQEIALAVRRHHDPIEGSIQPGSVEAVTFCVEVADRLAVMVLDSEDLAELSPQDLVSRVDEMCLWSDNAQAMIKADALAKRIDRIVLQSNELFDGLGLV